MFEHFTAGFSIGRFVNISNIKADLIRLLCDTGQVLITLFRAQNNQCNRVWHNTLPPYAASHWLCYLFIAIPTSQGMPTNMIEISRLLLISPTECAQCILCRRILSRAVGALVFKCWESPLENIILYTEPRVDDFTHNLWQRENVQAPSRTLK